MIFDFLKRNPKTYRPEFAIAEEGKKNFLLGKGNRVGVPAVLGLLAFVLVAGLLKILLRRRVKGSAWPGIALAAGAAAALSAFLGIRLSSLLPSEIPWPINNRRGTPFWEEAGRKGISSVVMHVPVTFPAVDYDHGRLLSGLGVTDVRGRVGTPSYYTSDPFFAPKNKNEFSVELVRLESNKGTIETEVFGPYNKLFKEPPVIKTPMTLTVAPDGGSLTVAPKGSQPLTLKVGEWSPWVVFTFPFNSLVKMTGIGRFHLASLSPEIRLYLSPIHFNPSDLPPSVKITAPASLSKKLADRYGLYKTMGWQIDTWSMSEETIDEKTFLEDVDHTVEPFRKMMNDFLDEKDVRLFVQIYEFPDRVAHCFWRFLDPQHPAYDAAKAAKVGACRREDLRADGRDRGRRDEEAGARGHPDRPVRPRLRDVAAVGQLQHVARRERLHDAQGRRRLADGRPRDALRAGRVLAERGLVEDEGLRDGPRRHLRQPEGARGQGVRLAGRRVRGRARRDQEEARDARGPEDGAARRVAHLHARGGLRLVRRRRHPGPLRDEHGGHAHRLAGQPRRRDEGDVRGQRADLVRGPLLAGPRRRPGHPLRESRASERTSSRESRTFRPRSITCSESSRPRSSTGCRSSEASRRARRAARFRRRSARAGGARSAGRHRPLRRRLRRRRDPRPLWASQNGKRSSQSCAAASRA